MTRADLYPTPQTRQARSVEYNGATVTYQLVTSPDDDPIFGRAPAELRKNGAYIDPSAENGPLILVSLEHADDLHPAIPDLYALHEAIEFDPDNTLTCTEVEQHIIELAPSEVRADYITLRIAMFETLIRCMPGAKTENFQETMMWLNEQKTQGA